MTALWPWAALVVTLYLIAALAETYPESTEVDPLSASRRLVMALLVVIAAVLTVVGFWGLLS